LWRAFLPEGMLWPWRLSGLCRVRGRGRVRVDLYSLHVLHIYIYTAHLGGCDCSSNPCSPSLCDCVLPWVLSSVMKHFHSMHTNQYTYSRPTPRIWPANASVDTRASTVQPTVVPTTVIVVNGPLLVTFVSLIEKDSGCGVHGYLGACPMSERMGSQTRCEPDPCVCI